MTYGTAEGGVISKEIKRIFQRVGDIIDENQKKNRDQNDALRNSSLDRKRGMRELHFGTHVGCDRRGSLRAMSGDGLGCQTVSKAHDMSRDMALISCPTLSTSVHCWESRSSISRVE